MGSHSLYSVQAIAIIVSPANHLGKSDLYFTMLATAIRIAQALNINHLSSDSYPAQPGQVSPPMDHRALITREVCKRVSFFVASLSSFVRSLRSLNSSFPSGSGSLRFRYRPGGNLSSKISSICPSTEVVPSPFVNSTPPSLSTAPRTPSSTPRPSNLSAPKVSKDFEARLVSLTSALSLC